MRVQGEEECYWSHDLGYEVDEELRKMTGGKEFSDEEMFNKFFEAFDLVLNRDYPQYLEVMNGSIMVRHIYNGQSERRAESSKR